MEVQDSFIDIEEFDSESKSLMQRISNNEKVRILRGHNGKPSFILENDESEVTAEVRPTEDSNYIFYEKDDSSGLNAGEKLDNLNQALQFFVSEVLRS